MTDKELEQIRKRWDEYSETKTAAYRAFMFEAHRDVGKLLAEVDRLRREANGRQVGEAGRDSSPRGAGRTGGAEAGETEIRIHER